MANDNAQVHIDETLRASRDTTERRIAWARVALFGVGLVSAVLIQALASDRRGPSTQGASWVMAVAFLYALAILFVAQRRGAVEVLMLSAVGIDMCAVGAVFVVTRLLSGPPTDLTWHYRALYPTYILPAALFCLTLLNSLRFSRLSAVVGGVTAQVVFWAVAILIMEPHPALPVAAALLLLGAAVAYVTAVKARESLERFARLQLLRRYLSPAAVRRVLESNPDQALALGGEVVTVTLLSADLRDFTAMSEKLSAVEVVDQLNEYHGTMLAQIERRGGVLDKFIGDGALAVFGLDLLGKGPTPDRGAAAAVSAAQDMVAALALLNADRALRSLPTLRMGIGIHTGTVVAGNIGAPGRRVEFTVIGDSVNTAARLEGLTKQAGTEVLVSADTAGHLPDLSPLRALAPMPVRGKEKPLDVFALSAQPASHMPKPP